MMLRRSRWAAVRTPKEMGELTRATTTSPPPSTTPMPPARTIQMESHGIAIPAPTHEAGAGHLPYADPHALQACRAKRHNRHGSTAPRNPRNLLMVARRRGGRRWMGGKGKEKGRTRSAGGVPTWADIARASTSLYISGGAGYTKPNARRPAGKGKKKQQGH
jgi:hypothetical protein